MDYSKGENKNTTVNEAQENEHKDRMNKDQSIDKNTTPNSK